MVKKSELICKFNFVMFRSREMSLGVKLTPVHSLDFDYETQNSLVEYNKWKNTCELAKILNSLQFTIYRHRS